MNVNEDERERKNIRFGIVLTYLRLAISIIVGLLYPPYLLQKVGLVNNGLYFFATSLITYTLLISLGMENSYVHFSTLNEKAKGEDGLKQINGFYLICFGVMALLMLAVGITLAFLYGQGVIPYKDSTPNSRHVLFLLILIASVVSSVDFFLSLFTWYVYYKSRFIVEQLLYLAIHIFSVLGSFLFLYFGYDIIAVSLVSGSVLLFFDILGAIYAVFKLKMSFAKPNGLSGLFKQVFTFTLYIFFVVIVSTITTSMGKTILGQMVGMGAVTIFGYGLQFYLYENQISMAISSQFSPRINSLAINNKQNEISALFSKVSLLQLIVLFLIVGGFASCGQDFIQAWLGNSELQDQDFKTIFYLSLSFLLLGIVPLSQNLGIEIQRAENKHRYLSIVNLVCSVASIGIAILCVYLLPQDYKVYGPLLGIGCSLIVGMVIFSSIYYQKDLSLPIKHYYFDFLKTGIIAAVSWAIVFILFRYAIKISESWNLWWGTIIKGCSFSLLFISSILLFYQKDIKSLKIKP